MALIQHDLYLYRKRMSGHGQTLRRVRPHGDMDGKDTSQGTSRTTGKSKKLFFPGTFFSCSQTDHDPVNTLILEFHPLALS